jgi:hypothetical protein
MNRVAATNALEVQMPPSELFFKKSGFLILHPSRPSLVHFEQGTLCSSEAEPSPAPLSQSPAGLAASTEMGPFSVPLDKFKIKEIRHRGRGNRPGCFTETAMKQPGLNEDSLKIKQPGLNSFQAVSVQVGPD